MRSDGTMLFEKVFMYITFRRLSWENRVGSGWPAKRSSLS